MNKSFKTALAAVASGVVAVALPVSVLAYGPTEGTDGRKYFDFNNPSTYPNYPAFNSFKNSPSAGFEPDFTSIKKSTDTNWDSDDMVTLEPGVTYDVYVGYHNNAPLNTNEAINTRIWVDFPSLVKAGTSVRGDANLSADNATPKSIWSSITFNAVNDTLIRYKQGSAYVQFADNSKVNLPNEGKDLFIKPGQLVGKNLDGKVLGCDANSGIVYFQIVADQPDFTVSKEVRVNNDGQAKGGWTESVKAKKGDTVDFIIEFDNTGTIQLDNVIVKDVLPAGLEFISNSTVLYNGSHPTSTGGIAIKDGVVSSTGLNIGSYAAGANAMVKFSAKVTSDDCGSGNNIAKVITANGSREDGASVQFDNVCKEKPVEKCDVEGKTHLDKNDPDCKKTETPVTPPKELPKTGATSIATGIVGLASIATAGAYYIRSRKQL